MTRYSSIPKCSQFPEYDTFKDSAASEAFYYLPIRILQLLSFRAQIISFLKCFLNPKTSISALFQIPITFILAFTALHYFHCLVLCICVWCFFFFFSPTSLWKKRLYCLLIYLFFYCLFFYFQCIIFWVIKYANLLVLKAITECFGLGGL